MMLTSVTKHNITFMRLQCPIADIVAVVFKKALQSRFHGLYESALPHNKILFPSLLRTQPC